MGKEKLLNKVEAVIIDDDFAQLNIQMGMLYDISLAFCFGKVGYAQGVIMCDFGDKLSLACSPEELGNYRGFFQTFGIVGQKFEYLLYLDNEEPEDRMRSCLVHELTHMVDAVFNEIHEHKPSEEFRAYLTEHLFACTNPILEIYLNGN